jgi:hypothetical protein
MAEEPEMSVAATRDSASGTDFEPKPPAPGRETRALLKRVVGGNKTCLPAFRALLADGERGKDYAEAFGSPADWLRESLIKNTAGENPLIEEAIGRKLDRVRSELEGPNPSPIERLLAERASLCWFIVHRYETMFVNSQNLALVDAEYQQRKIDRAHGRFLSAVRTLAQVRKLGLPALQINVGANQVNMIEGRDGASE